MRNRLCMGALRYGRLNAVGKQKYARIPSMVKRLRAYEETGNLEFLVDVANLCLLEFEDPQHQDAHFEALDGGHSYHVGVVGSIS